MQIDDKLSFNLHISKMCNSAANQLNAMTRLKNSMTFSVKEALINSYFMSNFNYCPLGWMFSSAKSISRIENFENRALDISSEEDLDSRGELSVVISWLIARLVTVKRLEVVERNEVDNISLPLLSCEL